MLNVHFHDENKCILSHQNLENAFMLHGCFAVFIFHCRVKFG